MRRHLLFWTNTTITIALIYLGSQIGKQARTSQTYFVIGLIIAIAIVLSFLIQFVRYLRKRSNNPKSENSIGH